MENPDMNASIRASSTHVRLRATVEQAIEEFRHNEVCQRVDRRDFTMAEYHQVLRMIFNQVRETPFTFALAGVNCPSHQQDARDYLLHHADEEKTHWEWVLNDLEQTGYPHTEVREAFPLPACQDYIAFNYYVALRAPVARLAIAAVLEGIGASYGAHYAREICRLLSLSPQQTKFYAGHGQTDREHILDIWRVIEGCELTDDEWRWMNHAAQTAGRLYRSMYNEALT